MAANEREVAASIVRLQAMLDAALGANLRRALQEAGIGGEVVVSKVHDELVFEVKKSTIRRVYEQAGG